MDKMSVIKKINFTLKIAISTLLVTVFVLLLWKCTAPDEQPFFLFLLPPNLRLAGANETASPRDAGPKSLSTSLLHLLWQRRQMTADYWKAVEALIDMPYFLSTGPSSAGACRLAPLLAVVATSTPNAEGARRRHAARRVWRDSVQESAAVGDKDPRVSVVYAMGAPDNWNDRNRIMWENYFSLDIVEAVVEDVRISPVVKHAMALKWAAEICPSARFVLRTSDESFVDIPSVLRFLEGIVRWPGAHNMVMCRVVCEEEQIRVFSKRGPRKQQCFCDDRAVLYSGCAASKLFDEVKRGTRSLCSEVDLTGKMAARVNLTLIPLDMVQLSLSAETRPESIREKLKQEALDEKAQHLLVAHRKGLNALRVAQLLGRAA